MGDNGAVKRGAAFQWRKALSLIMEYAVLELDLSREESFSYAFGILENPETKEKFRQFLKERNYARNKNRNAFDQPGPFGAMLRGIAHSAEVTYI